MYMMIIMIIIRIIMIIIMIIRIYSINNIVLGTLPCMYMNTKRCAIRGMHGDLMEKAFYHRSRT